MFYIGMYLLVKKNVNFSNRAKPLKNINAVSVPSFNHSFSKNMNGYTMIYLGWSHYLQYGISLAIRIGRRDGEIYLW